MGSLKSNKNDSVQQLIEAGRLTAEERTMHLISVGVASVFGVLGLIEIDVKITRLLVIAVLLFAGVVFIHYFRHFYKSVKKGSVELQFVTDSNSIVIKQNDYQINMDDLLNSLSEAELKKLIFVVGIDAGGIILNVLPSGTAYSVREYLDKNYKSIDGKKPSACMQESIDDYIRNNLDKVLSKGSVNAFINKKEYPIIPFNTCIISGMMLKKDGKDDKIYHCNVMMVVNSKSTFIDNKLPKIDEWPNSNDTVPTIFEKVKDSGYEYLMMAVIGTNKLLKNYQVILSQIINQFARNCKLNGDIKTLYISIRKTDYGKTMTLSQIYKYNHESASFYKHKQ